MNRSADFHLPDCPADHDCSRDHPEADVYHPPRPCTCGGVAALVAERDAMRAVLERCETSGGDVAGNAVCPICCEDVAYDEAGERLPRHAADCRLAKVLGRVP